MKKHITGLLLLVTNQWYAQFYSLPTEHSFNLLTEKNLARRDSFVHPGMQPYIPFFNRQFSYISDTHRVYKYIKNDPAIDLIFKNHLVEVTPTSENFTLHIDPILNLETGRDLGDSGATRLYTNTRGIAAAGAIGERFYFETMFAENQSVFPNYISAEAMNTGIVPGQGRWKRFKKNGYDYAFASGIASIQLWRQVNLQFGHGKQKIGHGYRSLLLSDNAFNYPFTRITQQWFKGKLRYTNIYASLMNLSPASEVPTPNTERLFQKKAAAFQYLEFQPLRALSIGLFQGVIWEPGDARNRQHLTWQYFNPIIYSHLITFGTDHPRRNVLAGADLLLKFTDKISLYCQIMTDHNTGNGFQGGLKFFDAFGIKNLTLRAEYNTVSVASYSGTNSPEYSHYDQNLAYTPANGNEGIMMADYRQKRFYFHLRHNMQVFEGPGRSGTNISSATAGYLINPSYNLCIALGYLGRRNFYYLAGQNLNTDYLYISLKTSIYNLYYDF